MNTHHTKIKGDIGLVKAIAELTELNYIVSIPISEHQHYDIIVDFDGILKKYKSNIQQRVLFEVLHHMLIVMENQPIQNMKHLILIYTFFIYQN